MFCDMWATTIVYYTQKCETFYNEKFWNMAEQEVDGSNIFLIHYYNAKYNNQKSLWKETMEIMKKEFAGIKF